MIKETKNEKRYLAMGKFQEFINEKGLDEKKVFVITHKDDEIWDNPQTYIKIYEE